MKWRCIFMTELGNIRISDEVVKTIAASTTEVDGVYKLAGGMVDEVSKILGKKESLLMVSR